VAPSSVALIVGRAVAGMGVGGIFSGALVIIAHSREDHSSVYL
jgi:MFS family permease